MIEVTNYTKVYKLSKKQMKEQQAIKDKKVAVDGVSFLAKDGEIFGLLGPNGAGKTTTLRAIATLLKPSNGRISVQGIDVEEAPAAVRKTIGFLTNELKLDAHFTPSYTVRYFGRLYGLDKETITRRSKELFDYFGITEFADKKIGELSTGMKQKLSIAVSLIHDPEVIIFDEPTSGLDIITARAVTDYLMALKGQGKLIIISTHIMSVAEKLCDRIAILIGGKIVAEGKIQEVEAETGADSLEDAFFNLYSSHIGEEF